MAGYRVARGPGCVVVLGLGFCGCLGRVLLWRLMACGSGLGLSPGHDMLSMKASLRAVLLLFVSLFKISAVVLLCAHVPAVACCTKQPASCS